MDGNNDPKKWRPEMARGFNNRPPVPPDRPLARTYAQHVTSPLGPANRQLTGFPLQTTPNYWVSEPKQEIPPLTEGSRPPIQTTANYWVSEPRVDVPPVPGLPPTPTTPGTQPSPDWTPSETPTQEQPFVYPPTPTSPTIQPEFEGTGARPKERRQSLTPAPVSPKRRSSGLGFTPESSLSATRRFDTPYVRLPKIFKNAPLGYQSSRSGQDLTGELSVSSDDESVSGEDLLTQKTVRDLRKLKARGFDISFGEGNRVGKGAFGEVYRGVYTEEIYNLSASEAKYLADCEPGMPFAAKYVKLGPLTGTSRRINHEIEKQTMKGMADHENVVKYKLTINLGAVKVIQNIVNSRHDFNSYDRMFIIMEWADQGTLKQFIDHDRVNDMYATIFMMQLCAGMRHLHREGVIHGDVYSRNVLLFTEEECPGGLMAKWTDFGRSISRKHWSGADVSVQDLTTLLRRDTHEFGSMLASLLAKADASPDNEGHDLQTLKEMANTLKTTPKTLDEVLTDYHFGEEDEE